MQWRHLGGGSRVAMATPDQAVATPEIFGPMRRGGQEFIDIFIYRYISQFFTIFEKY